MFTVILFSATSHNSDVSSIIIFTDASLFSAIISALNEWNVEQDQENLYVFFLFDHLPATITVPTTDEEGIEGFFFYSFSSHMRLIWRENGKVLMN